jgi:hypothetical protein
LINQDRKGNEATHIFREALEERALCDECLQKHSMGEDSPLFACEGRGGTFIIRWNWDNRLLLWDPLVAGRSWLRPLPDDNQDLETGHKFAGRKRASRKKRQSRKIGTLSTSPWISEFEISRQS